MSIQIVGWALSNKDPGFFAETLYGTGRISIGAIPIKVVCTGTKTTDGSMTTDQDIEPCYSLDDAYALVGYRSTATQQAKAALTVDGINLYLAPPAEAGTVAAAHATVTFGGTTVGGGSVTWELSGQAFEVNIADGDTLSEVGDAFVAALESQVDAPGTSVNVTGTVTVNISSKGAQGNNHLIGWDVSQAPAGLTITVAGGTAVHPRLVPFVGGTGTESLTNVIALLKTDVYDFIAAAQTDAGNAALLEAHVDSEAGPNIGNLEHVLFGNNKTLATAVALAQTTLNAARCSVVWYENTTTHPAAIAANAAALRASVVAENPNYRYAGAHLKGVAAQRYKADFPGSSTRQAALNSGVTPLQMVNSEVRIVRDCVTKSLNGTTPDYRCYGWPDADVPDRMRKEAKVLYESRVQAGNWYVGPDPATGEKSAAEEVETPATWRSAATALWKEKERTNWLSSVDANPIVVEYNTTRKALVWIGPCEVRPQNLQMGASIRQKAA